MKHCFSTVLLLMLSVFSLSATTSCPAPTPASGAIVNEGESTIELRWEEVPGASSYKVTTIDLEEGMAVAEDIIGVGEYVQANLDANKDYQFEIRASYCWGGPYGQPLVLRTKGTIIIVDVILQIQCEDDGLETIYSGSVSADDNTTIDIPVEDEGCYIIEMSTQNLVPNLNLSMVMNVNNFGGLNLNNVLSNASNFYFLGFQPLRGLLINLPPDKNTPIVDIDAQKNAGSNFEAQFNWQEDMFVTITYCEDCDLVKPGHARIINPPVTEKNDNDIKIYPNPVANLLQLQIPKKGYVQIWDMTGRSWFQMESEKNEDFEIDTSNWPSGTYTLRWNEDSDSRPPRIKLFLKL